HPIIMPGRIGDARRDENFEYNLKFFRRLVPALEKWNVKCAIENLFKGDENGVRRASECSYPQETLDYISELGSDLFCSCADTGHFAISEKDTGISVGDAIRQLGKTLEVLHVQENDGINDLHVVPYTLRNVMDWEDIIAALREIGYTGTMNFEVMPFVKQFPAEISQVAVAHIGNVARYFAKRVGD
ncbi:MAG: sugar phosphate isomerase/epimerase, partial [Spirochaetales bacterium]|nr:sugar phosphate isomerase/epimerase [Spirochaetales bacterium]